jgi:hypothetical protein
MVIEVSHEVVWYSVGQKLMESGANHYFDYPQAYINLHVKQNLI